MAWHEDILNDNPVVTATRATSGTSLSVNQALPGSLTLPCTIQVYRAGAFITALTATAWVGQTITVSGTIPAGFVDAQCNPADTVVLPAPVVLSQNGVATGLTVVTSAEPQIVLTYAATTNIDFSLGNRFKVTLTGNVSFTASNVTPGQKIELEIVQDGTGSRLASAWIATTKWGGGTSTLSTAANSIDIARIRANTATTFRGDLTLAYA